MKSADVSLSQRSSSLTPFSLQLAVLPSIIKVLIFLYIFTPQSSQTRSKNSVSSPHNRNQAWKHQQLLFFRVCLRLNSSFQSVGIWTCDQCCSRNSSRDWRGNSLTESDWRGNSLTTGDRKRVESQRSAGGRRSHVYPRHYKSSFTTTYSHFVWVRCSDGDRPHVCVFTAGVRMPLA